MADSFGGTLRALRESAGVSLRALSKSVYCSHGHVADLEAGRRQPSAQMAAALDQALGADGALSRLVPDGGGATFRVRSHKLVAAFLGADQSVALRGTFPDLHPHDSAVSDCGTVPVSHPTGEATLYLWGHGAAVAHIVEEDVWRDITSLALWRYDSYERDLKWIESDIGLNSSNPYVLSLYWVEEPAWTGSRLDAALRLICRPRILVGQDPGSVAAGDTEAALLRDGVPDAEMVPFSSGDSAIGLASWSGVVYHPMDADRALSENDLVQLELAVQSIWQYCSWIGHVVESGEDPQVPEKYGWRWLRAIRSRLLMARPQESGLHKEAREAILETCGLPAMLEAAISTLKETTT